MGAVVGVDASISSTGLAVLGAGEPEFRRVQTRPRGEDIASRVGRLRESVVKLTRALDSILYAAPAAEVDLVVLEMPAFGKSNGQTHMLAGHWWLTVHALEKYAPGRVTSVATTTLKKFATGSGRADKADVHSAAVRAFPGRIPADFKAGNDIADSAVLASMGAVWLGREFGGVFAPSGMASVQAVRWPRIEGEMR